MTSANTTARLAASITRAASKQTYYTIRFLADRERVADAYRAYAYLRWIDDRIDTGLNSREEQSAFVNRQQDLVAELERGQLPGQVCAEEEMLVELVRHAEENNTGLHLYLRDMLAVMAFDAGRRGRLISQAELSEYTHWLASAVTEAMHYFIGHKCYSPHNDARYAAVTAAHITHMLRDTFDDLRAGYYNIPREVLEANNIGVNDVQSEAYRAWVRSRVQLARRTFETGKEYLHQVGNWRCRLAGFAYASRFEWLLDTIEREDYNLRPQYDERKGPGVGLRMTWLTIMSGAHRRGVDGPRRPVSLGWHW